MLVFFAMFTVRNILSILLKECVVNTENIIMKDQEDRVKIVPDLIKSTNSLVKFTVISTILISSVPKESKLKDRKRAVINVYTHRPTFSSHSLEVGATCFK